MADETSGPMCSTRCGPGWIDDGTLCRAASQCPGSGPKGRGVSPEQVRELLLAKLGTCDFYKTLSDLTPGDREGGYYWNYGYKYCNRFRDSSLAKDPKAARWIECVTLNLQREVLEKCLPLGSDLEAVKACLW